MACASRGPLNRVRAHEIPAPSMTPEQPRVNLPDPAILAAEIVEDLQAALDQFAQIAADLAKNPTV